MTSVLSDSTKGRTVSFLLRGEGGWAISKNYSCTRTLKTDEKESCKESHGGKSSSIFYYPGAVFDFEKKFSHKLLPTKKIMYNLKMRKTFMPQDIAHLLPPPHLTVSNTLIFRSVFRSSGKRSGLLEMKHTLNISR